MSGTKILTIFFSTILLGAAGAAAAGMSGGDYAIRTSVMTGGGEPVASDNFRMESCIGQPSPLMEPWDPPFSYSYDLYPGFWYAMKGAGTCPGDFDGDGDVDGSDLYLYLPDTSVLGTGVFAENFGRNRCP